MHTQYKQEMYKFLSLIARSLEEVILEHGEEEASFH